MRHDIKSAGKVFLFVLAWTAIFAGAYILGRSQNSQVPADSSSSSGSSERALSADGLPLPTPAGDPCKVSEDPETVRGYSLSGVLNDGQPVTVLKGYYRCKPVERGDLVIYKYSGNSDPLVKSVKGIPGDRFDLKKNEGGLWNIVINDQVLTTSTGQPYALTNARRNMLAVYLDSYHGVIPKDAYLILGNLPEGTMDSTQFGLVNKADFIGKADTSEHNSKE